MENLIKLLNEGDLVAFYDSAMSFLDKSRNNIVVFFLQGKDLTDESIKESFEQLFELREDVDVHSRLSNRQKKQLKIKIDFIVMKLFELDKERALIKSEIRDMNSEAMGQIIKIANTNRDLFNSIYALLLDSKGQENQVFINSLLYGLFEESNEKIVDELERIIKGDGPISSQELLNLAEIINVNGEINTNIMKKMEIIIDEFDTNDLRLRLDKLDLYPKLRRILLDKLDLIKERLEKENKVEYELNTGNLYTWPFKRYPFKHSYRCNFEKYNKAKKENIMFIGDVKSLNKDTACSIKEYDDGYAFDVYVSDVPTILNDINNSILLKDAYNRMATYYLQSGLSDRTIHLEMLPPLLSHKFLALNKGYPKNVINFHFLFDKNGDLLNMTVEKVRIIVDNILSLTTAKEIIDNPDNNSGLCCDLVAMDNLVELLKKNSVFPQLKQADLVGFGSILVNSYIAKYADLAIYRDKGVYTETKTDYVHATSTLSRMVANINLGLYLNQKDLLDVNGKYIDWVRKNISEIVARANYADSVQKYLDRNNKEALRLMKLEEGSALTMRKGGFRK